MKRTESVLIAIVCVALAIIFLYLSGYAMFFTSAIDDNGYIHEPIIEKKDNVLLSLLLVGCGVALLWLFSKVESRLSPKAAAYVAIGWALAAGSFWVCAAQALPRADANSIYVAAQRVIGGNFAELKRVGGYFNQHPYQVGFLMVSELLQRLFGVGNALALQLFNVLCLGWAYAGVLCLCQRMTGSPRALRYCALLLVMCLQPVLYCTFLYGNMISIACALWAAAALVQTAKDGRYRRFWLAGLLGGLSVLFKPNGWLPVIAMLVVAGLWLLSEKKWRVLPLLAALVLGPVLITGGVKALYSARANADLSKGVPMTAYLAMGLQESSRAPGWYNEYVDRVYKSANYNPAKASAKAVRNLKMRLADFSGDPAYAFDFFHHKMVSQWNETTFEAIWVNKVCPHRKTRLPFADTLLSGWLRQPAEGYMEGYTLLIYLCFVYGAATFAKALLKRDRPVERARGLGTALLIVTVFGAFLYHSLFEAKSQYLFTYLLVMIPVAADGLDRFQWPFKPAVKSEP